MHCEYFAAPAAPATSATGAAAGATGEFIVELGRSRRSVSVPADRCIPEALAASGMGLPFSRREGMCGSCETAVREGESYHHDHVRSPVPVLVLDL